MPSQISSKEVLTFLNSLGYNNVNAQQLKEFIQDLKKLIKYEERRKSNSNSGSKNGTKDCSYDVSLVEQYNKFKDNGKREVPLAIPPEKPVPDIFTILYSQGTHSSKAKVVPRKESVISLQIKKNKCHHHCMQENKENIVHNVVQNKSEQELPVTGEERQNSKDEENVGDGDKKLNKPSKSKSSFIRPQIPMNSNKSDPVALYHYYKSGWDRYKIPGESNRSELRWAVREKMLSGPRPPRT